LQVKVGKYLKNILNLLLKYHSVIMLLYVRVVGLVYILLVCLFYLVLIVAAFEARFLMYRRSCTGMTRSVSADLEYTVQQDDAV
jgi:hypothetical protein